MRSSAAPSHGGAAHHGTAHRQGLKGSPTLPISQGFRLPERSRSPADPKPASGRFLLIAAWQEPVPLNAAACAYAAALGNSPPHHSPHRYAAFPGIFSPGKGDRGLLILWEAEEQARAPGTGRPGREFV